MTDELQNDPHIWASWRGLAGSSDAKVRIISESHKLSIKNWNFSKLFISFLMAVSIENRTFADGN